MSANNDTSESRGDARRSTAWFIGVFVVIVMTLLTGYRYAVDTPANDRYLFTVASHTSWLLGKIGTRSAMEATQGEARMDPKRLRAETKAWKRGDTSPRPEEAAGESGEPTTVWERYEHRILAARRAKMRVIGPHVSFTLRPGLDERVSVAEADLKELNARTDLDADAKAKKSAPLQVALAQMKEQQRAVLANPELRAQARPKAFSFIVIAECGAIEVMAIFFAAVIAFPTRWWRRAVGILLGVPIMYYVNILRLTCLGVIGALDASGKWFNFAHEYVWQAVYIVFVVMVWLAWIEFVVRFRRAEDEGQDDEKAA